MNKIDAEEVIVNIAKKEHLRPEYKATNPLGKIPCLVEGDFALGESAAILKYLAATNNVADHWYPGMRLPRNISLFFIVVYIYGDLNKISGSSHGWRIQLN